MKGNFEKWLRIRWEFMRDTHEYKEAFDRIIKIESNGTDSCALLSESINIFRELGLNFPWDPYHIPRLIDPNKSFDELNPFEIDFLLYAFNSKAVTVRKYLIDEINKRISNYDGLMLRINLNEVNSVEALKHLVNSIIDTAWKYYKAPYVYGYSKKKKTNWTQFEQILTIGRLKKEYPKTTFKELATKIFPEEMDPKSSNASPESAIKKAQQLYKRYEELTKKGGWKNLKFP